MGYGYYSQEERTVRANALGYKTKSAREIFKERFMSKDMNPMGVKIRESRDSDDHPESISIIIALDHTGSMGSVPHHLVKEGLPNLMAKIMDKGIKDPQILFLGIGDHKYDKAPLQIGQFESSDPLMDKWLTEVYLEGGGGGNGGESYLLAWYFASRHTSIDCFEKRGKKGYLITIGDEPTFKGIPEDAIKKIMGEVAPLPFDEEDWTPDGELTAEDLLAEAKRKYEVYHIHIHQTKQGQMEKNIESWKDLMGNNLIVAESKEDVPDIISGIITNNFGEIKWYGNGKLVKETI
jgi:hypothetical protein